MRAYLLLALAVLVAGLGAWGYVGHASAKHEKALAADLRVQVAGLAQAVKESEAERKRIAKVSRELTMRLKAQAARVAVQKKALNEAIQASPDWAATPVPDSVWDALGVRSPDPGAAQPGPGVDRDSRGASAARAD
jgi:hypothetical protein